MGLGDIVGSLLGVGGPSGAMDQYGQYAELFKNIDLPELDPKVYEELVSAGQLDPEIAQTLMQGNSNLSSVTTDPRLRSAQLDALSGLQDVFKSGGLNYTDKARLAEIAGQNEAAERGSREAILQNARARGIGGSGIELASQMGSQQASAGRRNMEGLNVAADAEARALQAMLSAGNLGGSIRSQDYSEQAKAAEAQDAINRFNTMNSQTNLNNAASTRNQAAQYNLENAQRIADTNAGYRNTAMDYNQGGRQQQQFENQLKKAGGASGAYAGMANTLENEKQRSDAFTGSLLGLGGTLGAGYLAGRK